MNTEIKNLINKLQRIIMIGVGGIIIEEVIFSFVIPSTDHIRLLLLVAFAAAMIVFEIRTMQEGIDHLSSPAGEWFKVQMSIASSGLFLFLLTAYFYPIGILFKSYRVKHIFAIVCLLVGIIHRYVAISQFRKKKAGEAPIVGIEGSDQDEDEDEDEEFEHRKTAD